MSFWYPITAAVIDAASFTIDKLTISMKRVTYRIFNVVSFPLGFLFALTAFLIFRPGMPDEFFKWQNIVLLAVSIILVMAVNLIFYRALKEDKLSELEAISLISKIPLIVFAGFIFSDERNPVILAAASIAVLAVVWSHWEKHHFKLAKKTWLFVLWVIFVSPWAGIVYKKLLEIWHPISLILAINIAVSLILIPMFRKDLKKIPGKIVLPIALSNLLGTISSILYFFSYQSLGIVHTVLLFSLQPLFVYFSALVFLKEKFNWKKSLAFIMILLAIVLGEVIK